MAEPYYADDGRDDGSVIGRSDGKLGFYGLATPIVKPVITSVGTTTGTTTVLKKKINRLNAALASLGLVGFS